MSDSTSHRFSVNTILTAVPALIRTANTLWQPEYARYMVEGSAPSLVLYFFLPSYICQHVIQLS